MRPIGNWRCDPLLDGDIDSRLEAFTGRRADGPDVQASKGARQESSLTASLNKAFAKRTYGQKVAEGLARADLKLTVGEFMALKGVTTVIGVVVGLLVGITNSLLQGFPAGFALAGAFIGYKAPNFYMGKRQSGRLSKFNEQLPDVISLMSNGLKAGNSVLQAMQLVSREAPSPSREEYGRVVTELTLGVEFGVALNNLVRRMPSPDLDLMVTSMGIQREIGGNLATVLESIGATIRERIELKGEIKTKTSQVMGSAYIMSGLPIIIGLVLFLINGSYMKPMFSGCFICMPLAAGGMIFMGFMAMKKIATVEV
ncbi:MAG: type secretion system protein [Dehalococcoidia bacterium]|nr:type secretion system protein [Dehalococcoidia bacterium]